MKKQICVYLKDGQMFKFEYSNAYEEAGILIIEIHHYDEDTQEHIYNCIAQFKEWSHCIDKGYLYEHSVK